MRDVIREGMQEARHLHGDIYEVRADGIDSIIGYFSPPKATRAESF